MFVSHTKEWFGEFESAFKKLLTTCETYKWHTPRRISRELEQPSSEGNLTVTFSLLCELINTVFYYVQVGELGLFTC
jgi:hypothetical protein